MNVRGHTIILVCLSALAFPAYADFYDDPLSPGLLIHSNNYYELLLEHWPRISLGDADSMSIAFNTLNNCSFFAEKIRASESIDDFDLAMRDEHPEMQKFGHGIYFKCMELVNHYEDYPGWQDLRLRAGLAGNTTEQLLLVKDFYRFRNERPRESFPYSPADFLTNALNHGNRLALAVIAIGEAPWGVRIDNDPLVSLAWLLLICDYSGDCDKASSMKRECEIMSDNCLKYGTVFEMYLDRAGSTERFARAQEMAITFKHKVETGQYDDLGLDLVW